MVAKPMCGGLKADMYLCYESLIARRGGGRKEKSSDEEANREEEGGLICNIVVATVQPGLCDMLYCIL